ncbi:MAG: tetratricopeptide repeat protein [Bacteroidia bacterium]|nr:tetratricopeptide repeat protein [Bacteroidia bacterium]
MAEQPTPVINQPKTEIPVVAETVESTINYDVLIQKYKNFALGILGGIVLAIGGYLYYQSYLGDQQKEAVDQMVRAVRFFEKDSVDKAIKGDSQYPGFEKLADEYSGTPAGNLCKYYLGCCYLKKGNINKGVEYLESFSKGDDLIGASAYAALAFAHEEKKDFAEAAKNYRKAASINENSQTTPFFLMNAARNEELAGNNAGALEIYQTIKRKFPNSQEGQSVEKYIAKFED